jgi:hypothetical protein
VKKKTTKTKTAKPKAGLRPSNDALNIAAIHLLALQIEQVATEVYVTDPDRFEDVLAMMREQVGALRGSTPTSFSDNDDECPEGWILCDGLCMPMCMA